MTQFEQDDLDSQRVQDAATKLAEHFDNVRIFCSRRDGDKGETFAVTKGVGDFYAHVGMVREWQVREDEAQREKVRRSMRKDE